MLLENLPPLVMPLIGVVLLGALIFAYRDDKYPLAQKILLVALAVFIMQAATTTIQRRDKTNTTALVMAGESANLTMRGYMAFDFVRINLPNEFAKISTLFGGDPAAFTKRLVEQSEEVLRLALADAPDSPYLQIRLALVLGQDFETNKREIDSLLSALQKNSDPRIVEYAGIVRKIYFGTVSKADEASYENTIETLMPQGWYRDTSLLRLYKSAGDTEAYKKYIALSEQKAVDWLTKILMIFILVPVIFLGGLVVLFVQLCLLAAKGSGPQKLLPVPGIGDLQAVITVLIAWMANEVIVSSFLSTLNIKVTGFPATFTSAFLAITYLLSNGPSWFYIYWFAFRRKGISLLSGLKLSVPGSMPARIFVGIATWMAAVPVVLMAFVLSSLMFGTHGSQSPVISILFQVARSGNLPAIALFYLSLAVLAPLCEEPLFRGLLYQSLRSRIGVAGGAIISAFLFAALHLDPGGLLPLFALGLVLAIVFEKTGSLVPSIIAHGLWNGANFTMSLLASSW